MSSDCQAERGKMKRTEKDLRRTLYLDLQLFDDPVMNTTNSASSGNDLSPEMRTYYWKTLIEEAGPQLVHDQFGQTCDVPKGNGKKVQFRKFEQLPKMLTPLTEGVTPKGQAMTMTTIEEDVLQYGGYILITDLLDLVAVDNMVQEATIMIGQQAGRTLDTVTREVLSGGTNVIYGDGSVTSRSAITRSMKLTVDLVKRAARILKVQNTPRIDGYYVGIIHPNTEFDLTNDPAWVDANKYTDIDHQWMNEIGKIGNVRFVESTEAKIFEKAGAVDGSAKVDVYSTLILGANAYGVTTITGGAMKTIIKQIGSGGAEDPLDQRGTIGWKGTKAAVRLLEQYMVRIETASTFDEGAN